jgi:hypothetical protein
MFQALDCLRHLRSYVGQRIDKNRCSRRRSRSAGADPFQPDFLKTVLSAAWRNNVRNNSASPLCSKAPGRAGAIPEAKDLLVQLSALPHPKRTTTKFFAALRVT